MTRTKNDLTVTINDVVYPIRLTMGAIVRFKQETGKELAEAEGTADNATLIWCCIKSACNREKRTFDYSLLDFVDNVDADEIDGITSVLFSLFGVEGQSQEGTDSKNAV
jgi:hypothetical protein